MKVFNLFPSKGKATTTATTTITITHTHTQPTFIIKITLYVQKEQENVMELY